jgi:hypothetical protein
MDGRNFEPAAYPPACQIETEFRVGVDNVKVEGTGSADYLLLDKYADPVLGLVAELKGFNPEHPFLGNGAWMLNGKNIGPVSSFFKPRFQGSDHGYHSINLGGVTIGKKSYIHKYYSCCL